MTVDINFVEDLKQQWMAMIDAIDDPLVIIDADHTILRQNKPYVAAAVNKGALSIREFQGKKCYEVFAGRSAPCAHCKLGHVAREGAPSTWTTPSLFEARQIEIRVHPQAPAGIAAPTRFVVHYRDVTELRTMTENLARADKLAALGKLAGGVAHEINSPLAGILAFSQMAIKEMDEENPHRSDMIEIEDAARKCKVIVEGLLGFARQDKPGESATFDVYEAARATLRLAGPMLRKHGIDLVVDLPEDRGAYVEGNAGKLGQVFLNLITNAIYAMKEGGGCLDVEGVLDGDRVTVSVRDTGVGIEPAVLGRIFDPFFTTKPIGEGTGLGLSISYSIVKQHGGEISVSSSAGVGTTFTVSLPLSEEAHA